MTQQWLVTIKLCKQSEAQYLSNQSSEFEFLTKLANDRLYVLSKEHLLHQLLEATISLNSVNPGNMRLPIRSRRQSSAHTCAW